MSALSAFSQQHKQKQWGVFGGTQDFVDLESGTSQSSSSQPQNAAQKAQQAAQQAGRFFGSVAGSFKEKISTTAQSAREYAPVDRVAGTYFLTQLTKLVLQHTPAVSNAARGCSFF